MVSIHTQWFDQDGSPLPEALEGYTGRMAKARAKGQVLRFALRKKQDLTPFH